MIAAASRPSLAAQCPAQRCGERAQQRESGYGADDVRGRDADERGERAREQREHQKRRARAHRSCPPLVAVGLRRWCGDERGADRRQVDRVAPSQCPDDRAGASDPHRLAPRDAIAVGGEDCRSRDVLPGHRDDVQRQRQAQQAGPGEAAARSSRHGAAGCRGCHRDPAASIPITTRATAKAAGTAHFGASANQRQPGEQDRANLPRMRGEALDRLEAQLEDDARQHRLRNRHRDRRRSARRVAATAREHDQRAGDQECSDRRRPAAVHRAGACEQRRARRRPREQDRDPVAAREPERAETRPSRRPRAAPRRPALVRRRRHAAR